MARLLSVSVGRGVEVTLNLVEVEKLFGKRAGEIAERIVRRVVEEGFAPLGLRPVVEEGLTFIRIYSPRAGSFHLGYIERAVEEVEARVLNRLAVASHYLTVFTARGRLEEFPVALYEVGEVERISRSTLYSACWELSRILSRLLRREAAPYGRGVVGIALVEGVEPPSSFKVALWRLELSLNLIGVRKLSLDKPRDVRFVKHLLNEAARIRLKGLGLLTDRLRAYCDHSVLRGPVLVRRGFEYASIMTPGGLPAYALAPRLSVEAREPLSEAEVRPGVRVRRLSDGLSGAIISRLEGGMCRVRIGGVEVEERASNLVKIYGMRELEEEGLASQVLREARMMQADWRRYASTFLKAVRRVEIAGQLLEFEEEPVAIEV